MTCSLLDVRAQQPWRQLLHSPSKQNAAHSLCHMLGVAHVHRLVSVALNQQSSLHGHLCNHLAEGPGRPAWQAPHNVSTKCSISGFVSRHTWLRVLAALAGQLRLSRLQRCQLRSVRGRICNELVKDHSIVFDWPSAPQLPATLPALQPPQPHLRWAD